MAIAARVARQAMASKETPPVRDARAGRLAIAGLAAFAVYFAMYAFRKPIAAVPFAGLEFGLLALDFKTAVILAQAIGYAISKLIGVRFVARQRAERRAVTVLALIAIGWLALLGFALAPPALAVGFAFVNGVPLGIIWGLVFSYLEGRRATEWLVAILSTSFIVSSGAVKSVGLLLVRLGVEERWMPFATGAAFMPVLLGALWVLARTPPPTAADIAGRTARRPMDGAARGRFLRANAVPLTLLILGYVLLAALRDFRDNFAAELWLETGYGGNAMVFSIGEVPIALGVLALLAAIGLVSHNLSALLAVHGAILAGAVGLGAATLAFTHGLIGPFAWMVLIGLGIYIAYAPFSAILFDRLIATTGQPANAGFLIYLADAGGYSASAGLLLLRAYASPELAWLGFFVRTLYLTSAVLAAAAIASAGVFAARGMSRARGGGGERGAGGLGHPAAGITTAPSPRPPSRRGRGHRRR